MAASGRASAVSAAGGMARIVSAFHHPTLPRPGSRPLPRIAAHPSRRTAGMIQDFESLTPTRDFSRRDFVATAVGSGFAAAVLPVGAQTITTDTRGLVAGPVNVPVGDFQLPAYRA